MALPKFGGLGDVVGALPIYLNRAGVSTSVIMPKFGTKWLNQQQYREVITEWSERWGKSISACRSLHPRKGSLNPAPLSLTIWLNGLLQRESYQESMGFCGRWMGTQMDRLNFPVII